MLRPGGQLALNLPAFQWLHSAHDVRVHNTRRFTAGGVRALLAAAGFTDVRARYWNALLFPLMVVQRKVLARGAESRSDVAPPPPWLNRSLPRSTALERGLMAAGLPFPARRFRARHRRPTLISRSRAKAEPPVDGRHPRASTIAATGPPG